MHFIVRMLVMTGIGKINSRSRQFIGLVLLSLLIWLAACERRPDIKATHSTIDQNQLDEFAESLQVNYTVINNLEKGRCGSAGRCFSVSIVLGTKRAFALSGWQLYFSQYFPLHHVLSDEFAVETINGDLKRIIPNDDYRGFKPGESKNLTMYIEGTHGNEFEAMPNYYVVGNGLEPRLVQSTVPTTDVDSGLEVMPHLSAFTDAERQFRITESENIQWATAEVLYDRNRESIHDPNAGIGEIIPSPRHVELDSQRRQLNLASGVSIQLNGLERRTMAVALNRLATLGVSERDGGIPLSVSLESADDGIEISESYSLKIDSGGIGIWATDEPGAFYALQSLVGLLRPADMHLPYVTIMDSPRYSFRGLHIDVARNFHSKELILRIIEQMAAYKLNKLHFHLGDDEGWRVQIPGLPELTDIGSKRCHDPTESRCLLPQLGSGPFGNTGVDGFYSVADYQEILATAAANQIQVIPSFDMPGHSRSAVKSMEARYRKYVAAGDDTKATQYLLTDLEDSSQYNSIQNYTDNTINVCLESSYAFVEKVITEMQKIHDRAGHPLTRYHIGADETAGAWKDSPECDRFLSEHSGLVTDANQLGSYFIERVAEMLTAKGIEPAGWGDGMGHTNVDNMPAVVQSNAWGRLIDPAHVSAHRQVNNGWEVVVSTPDVTYFDFPYEADPKERGFYWASRQTNTRKVFEFMPDNLPVHAEFWTDSEGLDFALHDAQPMHAGRGFVGMQGHVWSETMRSDEQVEYMLFPRLLALAERAWHRAPWEVPYDTDGASYGRDSGRFTEELRKKRDSDWNRFANIVASNELAKLDLAGIAYRIPTVGARRTAGRLHCNLIFPGLKIEFRIDEGDWETYDGPTHVGDNAVEVRAVSADGQRRGRRLQVH